MPPETVIDIGREALELTTVLTLVLLVPALVVGLLVSVFQAATQVNEATLSFIPKLIITFAVLMFGGHWLLALVVDYTRRMVENIPYVIG